MACRQRLALDFAALDRTSRLSDFDAKKIERGLRARVSDWRSLLRRRTSPTRQILLLLLDGRVAWTGRAKFDALLSGAVLTQGMVPVRGYEKWCSPESVEFVCIAA